VGTAAGGIIARAGTASLRAASRLFAIVAAPCCGGGAAAAFLRRFCNDGRPCHIRLEFVIRMQPLESVHETPHTTACSRLRPVPGSSKINPDDLAMRLLHDRSTCKCAFQRITAPRGNYVLIGRHRCLLVQLAGYRRPRSSGFFILPGFRYGPEDGNDEK